MRPFDLVAIWALGTSLVACGTRAPSSSEPDCLPPATGPFVAGSYESTSSADGDGRPATPRRWQYLRGPDRVAFDHPSRGIIEVWSRASRGDIGFERWFPDHKRSITYTRGDLAALGRTADWSSVSRIVPPRIRTALADAGTTRFRCMDATRHRGEVDGVQYELLWLTQAQLPARLTARKGTATHELVLTGLASGDEIAARLDGGRDYAALDYADIGDNESDPFVSKLIAQGFVEHPAAHDHSRVELRAAANAAPR